MSEMLQRAEARAFPLAYAISTSPYRPHSSRTDSLQIRLESGTSAYRLDFCDDIKAWAGYMVLEATVGPGMSAGILLAYTSYSFPVILDLDLCLMSTL